jgi:hypothetical protein
MFNNVITNKRIVVIKNKMNGNRNKKWSLKLLMQGKRKQIYTEETKFVAWNQDIWFLG